MRIDSSVTAISWIPSEAIQGMPKIPFELGIGHYDEPPPDRIAPGELERMRDQDRFREANELKAWVDVEDGKVVEAGAARFVQTVGGHAGFPAPRTVKGRPFFRVKSATAWTTLALTIRADGSSDHELVGASAFPRHWVYDKAGELAHKAGTIDFKSW